MNGGLAVGLAIALTKPAGETTQILMLPSRDALRVVEGKRSRVIVEIKRFPVK